MSHHTKKPFGFRYDPSEDEIVQTLIEFVQGSLSIAELSNRSISVKNIYEYEPWNLDWTPKEGMSDDIRYFCVQRKRASNKPSAMRACRRSGTGQLFWKNKGPGVEVCGGKALRTTLTLATEGQEGSSRSEGCKITWITHEYTLKSKSEWAICKVRRKSGGVVSGSASDIATGSEVISDPIMSRESDEAIFNDLHPIQDLDQFGLQP